MHRLSRRNFGIYLWSAESCWIPCQRQLNSLPPERSEMVLSVRIRAVTEVSSHRERLTSLRAQKTALACLMPHFDQSMTGPPKSPLASPWCRPLDSLVVVLLLLISPILVELVDFYSHIPLLSEVKGLGEREIERHR